MNNDNGALLFTVETAMMALSSSKETLLKWLSVQTREMMIMWECVWDCVRVCVSVQQHPWYHVLRVCVCVYNSMETKIGWLNFSCESVCGLVWECVWAGRKDGDQPSDITSQNSLWWQCNLVYFDQMWNIKILIWQNTRRYDRTQLHNLLWNVHLVT